MVRSKETKKAKNENITSIFAIIPARGPLFESVLPASISHYRAFCVRTKRKHHDSRSNGPNEAVGIGKTC